jgi:hypothetical protein
MRQGRVVVHTEQTCGTECGRIVTERNRYFTGKYMAARDFDGEQQYFLSRHRLHQRLLHGWGIVCGLRVVRHPDPACRDRWVVVRSGVAVDCCGRELILCEDTPVRLPLPRPGRGTAAGTAAPEQAREEQAEEEQAETAEEAAEEQEEEEAEAEEEEEEEQEEEEEEAAARRRRSLLLCVRYQEEPIEKVPALYHEGSCDPARREANRVRERAHIELCEPDDLDPGCWHVPDTGPEAPCVDDCGEELPGPGGSCLEPRCPCGEKVPLALISFDPDHPNAGLHVDTRGRRTLPTPPALLTHVVDINWPHGGELTLGELAAKKRRLEVRFDRRLLPPEGDVTGINEYTFVVQYGGIERNLEFLPPDPEAPPTVEQYCTAVFTIDPSYIARKGWTTIAGTTVFVTLKCDFILDCHENAVDGDFLRARLPSGDGVAGGLFESWFRVVPDRYGREA